MFLFYLRSDNFQCSSSSARLEITASQTTEKQISVSQLTCTSTFFLSFTEAFKVCYRNQLSLSIRSNCGRAACHCAGLSGLCCGGLLTPAAWQTGRARSINRGQQKGPGKIVSLGSSFPPSHFPSFAQSDSWARDTDLIDGTQLLMVKYQGAHVTLPTLPCPCQESAALSYSKHEVVKEHMPVYIP